MHLVAAMCHCTECGYELEARNAMGVAANHHKRTGHCVQVELSYVHQFGQLGIIQLIAEAGERRQVAV